VANVATLALVLILGGWWLARYTGLFGESGAWLLGGIAVTVVGAVLGFVTKLIPEGWLKDVAAGLTVRLSTRSYYRWLGIAFVTLVVASLWFGGFRVKDQSGAGARVAVYSEGAAPAPQTLESKGTLYFTRRTPPRGDRPLVVAAEGVPKRALALTPWHRAGEYELEYPRDFLRPVVLIATEKHLADKAEKYPNTLQLAVAVDGAEVARCDFDGHAVWVGCEPADGVRVPDERAKADWPTTADARFDRFVRHPKGDPALARPLAPGAVVRVTLYEDGKPRELKSPAEARTERPRDLGELVQVLTLYLK
jgi:hypothetical protein